jgi:hypothetical protein
MIAVYLALAVVGLLLMLEQWLRATPGPTLGLRAATLGLLFLGSLGAVLTGVGRDPGVTIALASGAGLPTGLVAAFALHRLTRPAD